MSSAGPGAPPWSGPFQRDRADDGRDQIGSGGDNHAGREGRGVEPVIDHGVEIGFEPAHALRIGLLAAQHVEKVRRVAEVRPGRERLEPALEAREGGNDGRKAGHDRWRFGGDQRDRAGGDAERVHRVDAGARAVAKQRERRGRQLALGGELRGECLELGRGREVPVPQEPRGLLKSRPRRELADR
jgi:hypothetical protein